MALSHQNQFRSPPSILTGYIDAITAIAWRLLLSLLGLYGHICAVCENLVSSGDHLPKPIETTHLYDDVPCLILKHTAGGTWQQPQNAVCASLLHTEKCYKALRLHFCYTFRQHRSLPGSRSGRCFASDASFFFSQFMPSGTITLVTFPSLTFFPVVRSCRRALQLVGLSKQQMSSASRLSYSL